LPYFGRRRIAPAGADGEVEAVVGQTLVDQGVLHALLDRLPKAVLTVLDTSRETRLYDFRGHQGNLTARAMARGQIGLEATC
jgi:hypothetical protein